MTQWHSGYSGPGDQSAPAGWYPVDGGLQRYWDGSAWTEHTAPYVAPPPPSVPPAPLPVPPSPLRPVAPDAPAPWVDGLPAAAFESRPSPQVGQERQPFITAPTGAPQGGLPISGRSAPVAPVSSDDRTLGVIVHLLGIVSGFIGPFVLWMVKRDESSFIDYHGKEALNFQISLAIYWVLTVVAMFVLIGFLLLPVLLSMQLLLPIMASVSTGRGESYRYPLTLRVIT